MFELPPATVFIRLDGLPAGTSSYTREPEWRSERRQLELREA
jgi:hypothetical protein